MTYTNGNGYDTGHRNVRRTDPGTSREAAAHLAFIAAKHRRIIINCLTNKGPLASEQIADKTKLDWSQVWKRCSDLERDGILIVHVKGGYRNRKSGRKANVYALHPLLR